jgi:hypothetical protein
MGAEAMAGEAATVVVATAAEVINACAAARSSSLELIQRNKAL